MSLDVLRKPAVLERLNSSLKNFGFMYSVDGSDENFLRLANCHREISLIKDLPDDDNFWIERLRLLEENNLLFYSL